MQTITEIVAAVVVHSSAAAYSHFGVTLEPPSADKPVAERSVARTAPAAPKKALKVPTKAALGSGAVDSAQKG